MLVVQGYSQHSLVHNSYHETYDCGSTSIGHCSKRGCANCTANKLINEWKLAIILNNGKRLQIRNIGGKKLNGYLHRVNEDGIEEFHPFFGSPSCSLRRCEEQRATYKCRHCWLRTNQTGWQCDWVFNEDLTRFPSGITHAKIVAALQQTYQEGIQGFSENKLAFIERTAHELLRCGS